MIHFNASLQINDSMISLLYHSQMFNEVFNSFYMHWSVLGKKQTNKKTNNYIIQHDFQMQHCASVKTRKSEFLQNFLFNN